MFLEKGIIEMNERMNDKQASRSNQPEVEAPEIPIQEEKAISPVTETIQQFGQTQSPAGESNIFCMTIIGQVEGHLILPPQNKTTKYEHIIPQIGGRRTKSAY